MICAIGTPVSVADIADPSIHMHPGHNPPVHDTLQMTGSNGIWRHDGVTQTSLWAGDQLTVTILDLDESAGPKYFHLDGMDEEIAATPFIHDILFPPPPTP